MAASTRKRGCGNFSCWKLQLPPTVKVAMYLHIFEQFLLPWKSETCMEVIWFLPWRKLFTSMKVKVSCYVNLVQWEKSFTSIELSGNIHGSKCKDLNDVVDPERSAFT